MSPKVIILVKFDNVCFFTVQYFVFGKWSLGKKMETSSSNLVELEKYAALMQQKVLTSQADLDPKDRPMVEMHNWCERQGDIVVLSSGLVLASNPASRSVQNCKIVMTGKGLKPGKIIPATAELISLLLGNAEHEGDQIIADASAISAQQQRLRLLIGEALREKVSDIHIEVRQDVAHIRFRKHGELYLHAEWAPRIGREIAAVAFNRETDHNITHFNPLVPQTASMPMHVEGQEVRLRLASLPAHGGFDVVLRLLATGSEHEWTLSELGYTDDQVALIRRAIQMPHGAILVAGPTGSGKTTTLASCMQMVRGDRKVYTIEDPVEKLIANATQVPVNTEKEDRDFASLGRAALRMDPDVIVLGELRDEGTARVLLRAAITGHLVFSTVHTHTATAIVTRLIDMGISPLLLSDPSVLVCLICQRLIPTLCKHCATPVEKSPLHQSHLATWRKVLGADLSALRARGTHCTYCKNSGVGGRTVIAEIVWVDAVGRQFIQKSDTLSWDKYLHEQGFQNYHAQALRLVRAGVCDPFDAEKVIGVIQ
jgi:type II secretory ATPase GspE/PulE/Tfp pilus assembly ATPase PilB-like protein